MKKRACSASPFAFVQLLFYFVNADLFAVFAHTLESDCAADFRIESVIRADADIGAGMDVSASLANENVARENKLTVSSFCAESLGFGISAVTG